VLAQNSPAVAQGGQKWQLLTFVHFVCFVHVCVFMCVCVIVVCVCVCAHVIEKGIEHPSPHMHISTMDRLQHWVQTT